MNARWLDEDILTRVFAHLTVQDVAQYALTICRKWRDVALFANHRCLRAEIFATLRASATSQHSPLFRFLMLFERNLLKDAGFNESPFLYPRPPTPGVSWQITKAGPLRALERNVPLEDSKRSYDTQGHPQSHDFGFAIVPSGRSYREMTQIVKLEDVLRHCAFSKDEGEKFLDLCLPLDAECEVVVEESIPKDLEGGWDMTVVLDDGTPLTAPYQNSTRTAFTREALHVRRFMETPVTGERVTICRRVDGYPAGVRRVIFSIGFNDALEAAVRAPRLSFSLDAATEKS